MPSLAPAVQHRLPRPNRAHLMGAMSLRVVQPSPLRLSATYAQAPPQWLMDSILGRTSLNVRKTGLGTFGFWILNLGVTE